MLSLSHVGKSKINDIPSELRIIEVSFSFRHGISLLCEDESRDFVFLSLYHVISQSSYPASFLVFFFFSKKKMKRKREAFVLIVHLFV